MRHKLAYRQWMENPGKPVLVLLHGLFGMADNLASLAKSQAAHCNVIVPDLVNHGHSFHRPEMTHADMARDVFYLLESLGVIGQAVHLLGHSMGGKVAMQMALQSPDRIASLVVADISPEAYPAHHGEVFNGFAAVASTIVSSRQQAETILCASIPDIATRQFLLKNLVKRDNGVWTWRCGWENIRDAYTDILAAVEMASYEGPVLFIKGGRSDYLPDCLGAAVTARFPRAAMRVIEAAGHWLHVERPVEFSQRVEEFLLARSTH